MNAIDTSKVMQVNLNATFALCRDVGAHILAQPLPPSGRRGSILNEWAGQGITVNAIAPGYVVTDMNIPLLNNPERLKSINERIPAGRWGKVEDFKAPAVFLCGSGGSYVTGYVLAIDGGWLAR